MAPKLLNRFDVTTPEIITVILMKSVVDIHGSHGLTTSKTANRIVGLIEEDAAFCSMSWQHSRKPYMLFNEAGSSPNHKRINTKLIADKLLVRNYPVLSGGNLG